MTFKILMTTIQFKMTTLFRTTTQFKMTILSKTITLLRTVYIMLDRRIYQRAETSFDV